VQRFLVALSLVGFTHLPLTRRPLAERWTRNPTEAAFDSVYRTVVPTTVAMLGPEPAARNLNGESDRPDRMGAAAGGVMTGGVPGGGVPGGGVPGGGVPGGTLET